MNKTLKSAFASVLINVVFSVYHIMLGVLSNSWWLLTIGVYYCLLAIMRVFILKFKNEKRSVCRFAGVMLMILTIPLLGTVILSFIRDRGNVFSQIMMITIAVYSFSKITFSIIGLIKSQGCNSQKMISLRNISLATALVSIFSLQRSMLVTFEGMAEGIIRIMNLATGTTVCVAVFLLGLNLVKNKKYYTLNR